MRLVVLVISAMTLAAPTGAFAGSHDAIPDVHGIYAEAARWADAHASSDERKRVASCLIGDPSFVADAVRCQRIGGELSRRAAHESGVARLALATLADMALQVGIPPALVTPTETQLAAYHDHIVTRDRALLREATRRDVSPVVRYARLMLGT